MALSRMEDARMPRKRHSAEEIVAKLRQVDVLAAQGRPVAEAIRSIGVTEVTYYRWRSEYGGLKGDQVKRLKELEAENARLRRAVSDLTLDKMILAEAARGTDQPRPSPRLRRSRGAQARRDGAPGLPGSVPTPFDTAQGPDPARRRGGSDRRHRCARGPVWPLRLPADRGSAALRRLEREPEARRKDLAT